MKQHKATPMEKKKWYKKLTFFFSIIGMISVAVWLYIGIMQIVQIFTTKPAKVQNNTEIVLARSDDMDESFDGKTKWDAALCSIRLCIKYEVE